MSQDPRTQVTEIIERLTSGDTAGERPEVLLPLIYDELRRLAGSYLRRERPDHTLQATELVHDAYAKLVDQSRVQWQGRTHFFAVAANAMRRLLVDHARKRGRDKRGGGQQRVTLQEEILVLPGFDVSMADLIALDDALTELGDLSPRQSQVVEMRCFAGLKVDEVAENLGVSRRSVEADWTHARAWLRRKLDEDGPR